MDGKLEALKHAWEGQPDFAACNFALGHLIHNLQARMTVQGRVHAETLLAAIGVIAGFAAQRALFAQLAETDDAAARGQLHIVETTNGQRYYFGDPLNDTLLPRGAADANQKLWSLAAGGAVAAGLPASELPSFDDMFGHVARTIGGEQEGFPSLPAENRPHLPARELLKLVWPLAMMCFTGRFPGAPREFGVAGLRWHPAIAAIAANTFIRKTQPVLHPAKGLVIVMESAIYASKLDPQTVEGATPA